jgi:[ribosomal protein S18]-alanine N-acetyltransferase
MHGMNETVAIELGLATPAEAPVLARMSRDYIENGLRWRWQAAQIRGLIRDPETVALCARSQPLRRHDIPVAAPGYGYGDILGFGVMTYAFDVAHLMLLAVVPRARRRNIASNLLSWLEETALTAGVGRIELEVRAGNAPARSFYRERGYHEREYLAGYYGGQESAFRMARSLRRS